MLHQKVTDKFPTMEWLALAQIFVFDRYGHNERELVLSELYLHSLEQIPVDFTHSLHA
jgi:hypothetical protein